MAFTDYTMGFMDPYQGETEEQRQRRLAAEAAANTPVKQTIVTQADGSQEMTIKGTPEALSSANPNTPTVTGPAVPDPVAERNDAAAVDAQMRAQAQAQARAQQQVTASAVPGAAPVAPVAPTDYNAYIAKNESGGNPNIGYHDQSKSSAYGTYGMTSGAYQDARRANPALPADITKATPEQQTAAQNAYTQQNAKYLQSYGVEPTPGNLAGAHFLGAKGLSDYLKTGYISPQAAAANGGEEKVRQIVNQRLGGAPAPASGAVAAAPAVPAVPNIGTPPTPGPGVQVASTQPGAGIAEVAARTAPAPTFESRFTEASTDPMKLLQLANDGALGKDQQLIARKQASELLNRQVGETKGKEQLAGMSETEIARMLKSKSEEGSWAKMLLLGFVSPELAGREAAKLGLNDKWQSTTVDGQPVLFKTRDGVPVEGYNGTTGGKLGAKELVAATAQMGAGKMTTGAEFFQDKAGNVYQSQRDERGGTRFVNTQTNKPYSGSVPLERLRDVAAVDTKRQTTMIQMAKDIATMDYGAKLKTLAEFRQKEINAGRADLTPAEMQMLIGAPPSPQATVGATAPAPAAPAPAPAAAGPAVPGTAATGQAPMPAAPAPAPAAAGGAAPSVQTSPALQQRVAAAQAGGTATAPAPAPTVTGRESVDEANKRAEREKAALEVDTAAKKKFATETAEDLATLTKNQKGAETKADYLLTKVDELIKHPGFGTSVGAKGPAYLFGLKEEAVAPQFGGGNARDWSGRFEEVKGGAFSQAIEALKGLGAMSDMEAKAATSAITRMKTSTTEDEFKSAAKDFQEVIQRRIDDNRVKLGQKPLYGTPSESSQAKPPAATGTTASGNKYKRVN